VTTEDLPNYTALGRAVRDTLRFNGKTALENGDHFLEVGLETSLGVAVLPDYSTAIRALRDFAPDVVVATGTDEFGSFILPALEADSEGDPPFYLLSPGQVGAASSAFVLDDGKEGGDLFTRILGVNFAAAEDARAYEAYQDRFDAFFPAHAGAAAGFENYYDAPYYLAYSAIAAGNLWPLRGPDLAFGMRRLLGGEQAFEMGPDPMPAAIAELYSSESITLNGTMGSPDFHWATGTRNAPGTVWCVDLNGRVHLDILRLNEARELEGTIDCFPFE
jgi:hypothetical protein